MSQEIICPDFCAVEVPKVKFSACSPVLRLGEISKLYVLNPEAPMADWADAAEWSVRLSDDGTGTDKIRTLIVTGDMPAAESTTLKISGGRTVQGVKARTIKFDIDDLSDENLDAARSFDCGGTFLIYAETFDGQLIGGEAGILGSLNLDPIIPRSRDEFQTIAGTVKWDKKIAPARIPSPLA